MDNWHATELGGIIQKLNTDPNQGLSSQEAQNRLEQYGANELVDRGAVSPWRILLAQFTQTMVIVLIIAAVISAYLGEYEDAVAIIAIVILNALLGFRQEYQAEQAMAALKKLAVPTVRAKRDGHVKELPASQLVPGDVILMEAGNVVPADGRLFESVNLRVQEAALTGESEPVSKDAGELAPENAALGDRRNMVYSGTVVTYGRGAAVVTSTGMKTELGTIAELMQSAGQESTPLQKRLNRLGKQLALIALILVAVVFGLGLLRGDPVVELFRTAISMAVAAIPEGLTAVVTIALALGAQRMLKRKALIRKLPAVETLGSVTVICSDKTGTLTENRMTVTILDVANHRIDLDEDEMRFGSDRLAMLDAHEGISPEQAETLRSRSALTLLMAGGALCNDAILEHNEENPDRVVIVGDPTEGALVVAAARMGLSKERLQDVLPRVAEAPFDSERKRMSTVHQLESSRLDGTWAADLLPSILKAASAAIPGGGVPDSVQDENKGEYLVDTGPTNPGISEHQHVTFTKGSVDGLLEISDWVWLDDHLEPMSESWCDRIEKANTSLAENGMRVLGVCFRLLEELPQKPDAEDLEKGLIFVGLMGMIDPARPEVKDAVQTCRDAGIRPMMITGDHPLTARFIAKELGFPVNGKPLTGQDLDRMSPQELEAVAAEQSVYARVSPQNKLQIVEALQARGQIAAMTGDGVNDAPALKKADIGVAMGITGTDVSKEASDMVLLDDNFATIVAAVEEGRVIYDNIRKFAKYILTSNSGEIWVMVLGPLLGMPLPLLPLQILWINLVTDGLPGLALGVEKPERDTMRRPPHPPSESIFARGVGRDILLIGFLLGIISLAVGYWYWLSNPAGNLWRTMTFTTLVFLEMGYVMAIRSHRDSLFSIGPFSNKTLIGAVVLTILLQLAVIYIPFLQQFFETVPLSLGDLAVCMSMSLVLFIVVEIEKWIIRIRDRTPAPGA